LTSSFVLFSVIPYACALSFVSKEIQSTLPLSLRPIVLTSVAVRVHLLKIHLITVKGKGKAVPLQAWSDPEGSRKLR